MSFITVERQNTGMVLVRLDSLAHIEKNDLVMNIINDKLDELYQIIFKSSPYKTGYLRSSIKVNSSDGLAQIAVTAYYARYLEKGTRRNTAQPFFFGNIATFSVHIIIAVRQLYRTFF